MNILLPKNMSTWKGLHVKIILSSNYQITTLLLYNIMRNTNYHFINHQFNSQCLNLYNANFTSSIIMSFHFLHAQCSNIINPISRVPCSPNDGMSHGSLLIMLALPHSHTLKSMFSNHHLMFILLRLNFNAHYPIIHCDVSIHYYCTILLW